MTVELELIDAAGAEAAYREIDAPSFFTSWGWIGNWLACLPADRAPRLLIARQASWSPGARDGDRIGIGCLAERRTLRRGVVPIRSLHLNVTGVPRLDELTIEYNGLAGHEPPLADLLAALPGSWDEVELPGVLETAFGGLAVPDRYRLVVERRSPVYFVDLETVRTKGYLAQLSSSTRSQVRRAQKAAGAITLELAGDPAHAIAIYDELRALHTAQWRERGHPGAFTDPWIDRFHRRLIATRFPAGEIQLARVRSGTATLGCLYNFVWRGRVLQYQTGFRPSTDSRDKPGYVCHTAAIEHCAAAGLAVYDFLAGDHRYKDSLSTGNTSLLWVRVQRKRWRFALEDRLVELVRTVRKQPA